MGDMSEITGDTRVAALLRDYPETEELLIGMSPAFEKLRNPILRRSVARVATLHHAAAVGGLATAELVDELRVAVGLEPIEEGSHPNDIDYFAPEPDWFDADQVVTVLREPELDPNIMPINPVLRSCRDLSPGEILLLETDHLPAPGIDILRRKGYFVWAVRDNRQVHTYVAKERE
jgi:hypothetical protein